MTKRMQKALEEIYDILFLESDEHGEYYDNEKNWSSDQLSEIGRVIGHLFDLPPEVKNDEEGNRLISKANVERPPIGNFE
jgi:hypothetical protein